MVPTGGKLRRLILEPPADLILGIPQPAMCAIGKIGASAGLLG
jgi:hypothetical protein